MDVWVELLQAWSGWSLAAAGVVILGVAASAWFRKSPPDGEG